MKTEQKTGREVGTRAVSVSAMVRCAACAALICVSAQAAIPLGPVPVTLQTLAVMLTAVLLKPAEAVSAIMAYILLGAVGVPVFSGMSGGIGKLAGATGGFIIGFLPSGFLLSLLSQRFRGLSRIPRIIYLTGILLMFTAVVYAFGSAWFMASLGRTVSETLAACVLPFLPGDALKIVAVILLMPAVSRIRAGF